MATNNKEILNYLYRAILAINFLTIIGSILSFIVFSRKAFQKNSIRIYCRALAIFDLYVIFNLAIGLTGQILDIQIISANNYICKIAYFITVGVSPIPGWILVVFSIDQLITVSMTKRFEFFKKQWFQYAIIIGIFIFHCALYSEVFILVNNRIAIIANVTYYSCDTNSYVVPLIYLVESSFVPFVIMIVTSSFIVRILVRSRRKIGLGTSTDSSFVRRLRDLKFAFNSVILNLIFILFTTPLVIYYLLPKYDFVASYYINQITSIFFYLNFALHFWVHLSFNSIFRNELLILFCIRKRQNDLFKNTTASRSRMRD